MVPIKGYHLLLQACASLTTRGIDWTLNMIGDGPERPQLERSALELGIASRVTFSGPVAPERIQEHYHSADVMVVSSFMEGVPVVLMEAMACGLVVVSTQVGGVPELVEPGVTGVLCPPGSASAMADSLARIASARPRFSEMGQAARQTVLRLHDIHTVGGQMATLFRDHVAGTENSAVHL
jgi:glycosyltransferase involved in cell wall biosynthesis